MSENRLNRPQDVSQAGFGEGSRYRKHRAKAHDLDGRVNSILEKYPEDEEEQKVVETQKAEEDKKSIIDEIMADPSQLLGPVIETGFKAGKAALGETPAIAKAAVETVGPGKFLTSPTGKLQEQVIGGALEAVQEIGNTVIDLADFGRRYAAENGFGDPNIPQPTQLSFAKDVIPEAKETVPRMAREVSQFLLPYMGLSKVVKGAQATSKLAQFSRSSLIGGAVDFAALDPDEKRFANFMLDNFNVAPGFFEYLVADEDDTQLEKRYKSFLEGLGLGAVAEGGTSLATGLMAWSRAFKANRSIGKKAAVEAAPQGTKTSVKVERAKPQKDIDLDLGAYTEVQKKKAIERTVDGVEVNLLAVGETAADRKIIRASLKEIGEKAFKAKRGIIPDKEVFKLAKKLNMKPEDILNRKTGEVLNAEEIAGANVVLDMAAKDMLKLARRVVKSNGAQADVIALHEARNTWTDLEAEILGNAGELGRALRMQGVFKRAKSNRARKRVMDDMSNILKPSDTVSDAQKLIELADMGDKDLAKFISKSVKVSRSQAWSDAALTTYFNGMLSSIKSQERNIISNAVVMAAKPLEIGMGKVSQNLRKEVAEALGKEMTEHMVDGEALAVLNSNFKNFTKGLKVAKHTWDQTDGGVKELSQFNKVDEAASRPISGERFGVTGTPGKAIDFIGHGVSTATRALETADAFFKGMNYWAEMDRLAFRAGRQQGLLGDDLDKFVQDFVQDPEDWAIDRSVREAREMTFTADVGERSEILKRIQDVAQTNNATRAMLPFVRTNFNMLISQIERTPVLAAALPKTRAAIREGGEALDEVLGRQAFGGGLLATGGYLGAQGIITGAVPKDALTRKMWEDQKWQPNSLRIGNKYYSLSGDEFVTSLLLLGANLGTVLTIAYGDRPHESDELISAATALVGEYMTPDLIARDMTETLDLISDDPGKFERAIGRKASSLTPAIIRDIRKEVDPMRRVTDPDPNNPFLGWQTADKIVKSMMNTLPWFSDNLPVYRNIWADPVPYNEGLGPDMLAVTVTSELDMSPIATEMRRLDLSGLLRSEMKKEGQESFRISRVPKTIGKTDLDPWQHDDYIKFSAGVDVPKGMLPLGMTLKEKLNHIVVNNYPGSMHKTDEEKRRLIRNTFQSYRNLGRTMMSRKYPQMQQDIEAEGRADVQFRRGF